MFELNVDELLKDIPVIDSNINYWFVRSNGGHYYTDFHINNYVGIGYDRVSLEEINNTGNNTERLKEIILDKYTEEDEEGELSQPGKIAGQLLRFSNRIVVNDIIVVPSESSQVLLVGRVTGEPYEISDTQLQNEDIVSNYKKSNFKKRIPVHWIGSFDRDKADSALYKMIFSQQTLSDINVYKPFINRALFPVYVEDGELHLTFNVSTTEGVNGKYLGQFIYFYTQMYELLFPDEEMMDIRVNVQSPGPIESVSNKAAKGLFVFALIATALSAPYGGSLKIGSDVLGSIELTIPGIISGKADVEAKEAATERAELENETIKLENIEQALILSEQLKVPITELGIDLPVDIEKYLKEHTENEKENPLNENPQD